MVGAIYPEAGHLMPQGGEYAGNLLVSVHAGDPRFGSSVPVVVRWGQDPVRHAVAGGVAEVFDEFFPPVVRPPRCVSKLGVDRPGILVSLAMVAVTG